MKTPAPSARSIAIAQLCRFSYIIDAASYEIAAATMGKQLCPDTVALLQSLNACKLSTCADDIRAWLYALACAIVGDDVPALKN